MSGDEWRRWSAAERDQREDDADVALRAAFSAVPRRAPSEQFNAHVADAVARTAARQARLARAVMTASGIMTLALMVAMLTQVPRLFRPVLDVGVGGLVWTVAAVDSGFSVWTVLSQMARTIAALIVAPQVTLVLMALALVAIAALYGLNRMLELEERSSS